jgi:HAMP domain-containing protein
MTIRSRLLSLLLPTLTAFVALIALFFYFNWSHEILNSFKSRLQSIVIATSQSINPNEIDWIQAHLQESNLKENPTYQLYQQQLIQLKQKLPILNLYIVKIEPVKEGERVLLNDPPTPSTEIYRGTNQENAYRQVFLIDASDPKNNSGNAPGDLDFSETEEHQIYFNKKTFVTPIYEARKTQERFMSAYAPILNVKGEVIALLGADVSMNEIDRKLQNALWMISLGTCLTISMIIITVFLIADRISKPVQQLNQAALNIAAGNYEANVQVKGPKEIVELANTLNTMSECLVENISRLRESSLIRERMYGEYECARLMQYYMLQREVENFRHPHLLIRALSLNLSPIQKGVLLKWNERSSEQSRLALIEAKEPGFSSLFELNASTCLPLNDLVDYPFIDCQFLHHDSILRYHQQQLFPPLVWSVHSKKWIKGENHEISLHHQDMIFLYNSGLIEQFEHLENIEAWFSKVLRHFAEDGLDTIHTMLKNELNFLAKKEHVKRNFHIVGIQMNIPEQL